MASLGLMKVNHVGEHTYCAEDLRDLTMQGRDVCGLENLVVDSDVDINAIDQLLDHPPAVRTWHRGADASVSVADYDAQQQKLWYMPQQYQELDIAQWVLDRCHSDDELQRAGEELLMFQQRGMFDLLRYLRYLVDVMQENHIVWGVGRGSSVASFVLYKIGVHRINSLYWDLDPREFLR